MEEVSSVIKSSEGGNKKNRKGLKELVEKEDFVGHGKEKAIAVPTNMASRHPTKSYCMDYTSFTKWKRHSCGILLCSRKFEKSSFSKDQFIVTQIILHPIFLEHKSKD